MKHSNSSRKIFKGYRAVILWIFVLAYSVFTLMLSIGVESRTVNSAFNERADEIHRTLAQRVSSLETVLTSLVGLYHSSDFLSIAERTSFSQQMLEAYPFIASIMHMSRVSHEKEEEFEARMRDQGFIGIKLGDDVQHSEVEAQIGDYHLPVSFIEPMDPLSATMLGYDLTLQPGMLHTLHQAIKSGETTAVGPIRVSKAREPSYFILKPVFLGRYPPEKAQERMQMFDGMAVLSIKLSQFTGGLIESDSRYALILAPEINPDGEVRGDAFAGPDKSVISKIVADLRTFSYTRKINIYGVSLVMSVEQQLSVGDIDWWRVSAIWFSSLLILALTISVYRNKHIALLQKNEANAAIAAEDARFSHVIDTAFDAVITADADSTIISWNQQAAEVFGYSEQDAHGQHLFQLILTSDSFEEVSKALQPIIKGSEDAPTGIRLEVEGKDKNNREFPLDLAISCSRIGELFTLSVFARDITERKQWDEKIRSLAYNDPLTQLPNRQAFKDQIVRAIKYAKRHNQIGAVLYLDLDEFKRINDILGHNIGDLLLKHVTKRLESQLRETDLVGRSAEDEGKEEYWNIARLGGDEFTVLLEDIGNPHAAGIVAKRVQDAVAHSYNLDGHEVYVTPSIGIAIFPEDGGDVEELLKNADTAMYHAKSVGKNNFQFYSKQMNLLATNRLKLEGRLRNALNNNELILYYQPQIDLNTGAIVSAEALLRWHDPELGIISPTEFIPIAEETGMIIELGERVLNEACRQNKAWQDAGISPIRIAVNLSSRQFIQHDLGMKVARALKNSGLSPEYMELELTESIVMRNVSETITALNNFKEMGICISVDDFGTGYSSLNYLKRFPLDTLKIDRTFVKDIPGNEDDVTITTAIIVMAKSLGLDVVAEGVETEDQLEFLRQQGCNKAQGYLFSEPLPADKMADMLRGQNRNRGKDSAKSGTL